ncbi:lantibiotic dehydratase [Nonomuraea sp. NPDC049695]|uniref:lantibiotic dehydratase n=1 Tax=Nonomuraea sp. NPDC049695 TaxID=3154734 RepID=UPI00343160BA
MLPLSQGDPEHDDLLPLGGSPWRIWRHFGLRSAGFPLRDLQQALAAPASEHPDPMSSPEAVQAAVDLASDGRIGMALLWQNPHIFEHVVGWLARHAGDGETAPKRTRETRRRNVDTMVKYLQRYHTKNETIGFFGPAAWGSFEPTGPRVRISAGKEVVEQERVHFEDWAIDRLADTLARAPEIRRHLPPAFSMGVTRLGRVILRVGAPPRRLSRAEVSLLDLVDGTRRAAEIAARLPDEAVALAMLDAFAEEDILHWGFDIPLDLAPERALRRQLRELPPSAPVLRALAGMDELCEVRDRVQAALTPAELKAALSDGEAAYARLAEAGGSRVKDAAEYGRRLFSSRATRAVNVRLGPGVLEELASPLALVLTSARWFCHRVGEEVAGWLGGFYAELAALYGEGDVPLDAICWRLYQTMDQPSVPHVLEELADRWASVLKVGPGDRHVRLASGDLAADVARRFATDSPRWYGGRHHSPDVMIAARGADAINRGDYHFVLGELHAGVVTCDTSAFKEIPPAPDVILRPAEAALSQGGPRFVPLYCRRPRALTGMSYPVPETFSPRYEYLSMGQRAGARTPPGGRSLDMAAIKVAPSPDGLVATFPDGRAYPLLSVVGELIAMASAPSFRIMPLWPHSPRVTVDRLVICRETWRIPVEEFVPESGLPDRELRRRVLAVAEERGIPRHTFWRAVDGEKPIYLDLHSPFLVQLVARAVKRPEKTAGHLTFTEMLPTPEELWLPDGDGECYTSELRITVVESTAPGSELGQRARGHDLTLGAEEDPATAEEERQ